MTEEIPTFVTHLECGLTGERYEADRLHGLSKAGKPLLVRYDRAAAAKALRKDMLKSRAPDLWRYPERPPGRRARAGLVGAHDGGVEHETRQVRILPDLQ